MRVLLIRHAQSVQNAYMEGVLARDLPKGEFNKAMRDAPPGMDAGADAALTAKGCGQARLLAEHWAPLLADAARRGRLAVFISPFLRTLLTADPLLRSLALRVPGWASGPQPPLLLPAIMELGGLTAAEDFKQFDRIDALASAGRRAEAMALFKAIAWEPMGLSVLSTWAWG